MRRLPLLAGRGAYASRVVKHSYRSLSSSVASSDGIVSFHQTPEASSKSPSRYRDLPAIPSLRGAVRAELLRLSERAQPEYLNMVEAPHVENSGTVVQQQWTRPTDIAFGPPPDHLEGSFDFQTTKLHTLFPPPAPVAAVVAQIDSNEDPQDLVSAEQEESNQVVGDNSTHPQKQKNKKTKRRNDGSQQSSLERMTSIAALIRTELGRNQASLPVLSDIAFTGPVFTNLRVNDQWLFRSVETLAGAFTPLKNDGLGQAGHPLVRPERLSQTRNAIVDFASPNLCKSMHVGHLRSMVLGESISRILELGGHTVDRVNHVGDFGLPIGLVIAELKITGTVIHRDSLSIEDLSQAYSAAKQREKAEKDVLPAQGREPIAAMARSITAHFQQCLARGDKAPASISNDPIWLAYQEICEISRRGYSEVARRLDINNREVGESRYVNFLARVVQEAKAAGLAQSEESAISLMADVVKEKLAAMSETVGKPTVDLVIEKSDGSHLYSTTDLAALKTRVGGGAEWIVYVVDESQQNHFETVFSAGQALNWFRRVTADSDGNFDRQSDGSRDTVPCVRVDHVKFGVVRMDGKKVSSRDGGTMSLDDLLAFAENATRDVMNQRLEENAFTAYSDDADAFSRLVRQTADNALKFYDLRTPKGYTLNLEDMLSLKGKSAMFVMYASARAHQILRAAEEQGLTLDAIPSSSKLSDGAIQRYFASSHTARRLARELSRIGDVIVDAEQHLSPNEIVAYAYDLSSRFNQFYTTTSVLQAGSEEDRAIGLKLCAATATALRTSCFLLGVRTTAKV